jgi:hypothetical protein
MNERNESNASSQERKNVTAALSPQEAAKRAQDERAEKMKDRVEQARKVAKEIEKKVNEKAEAKAREARLSDDEKKHLEEVISFFDDLEPEGVLSYRMEPSVEGKPHVLRLAIKNTQPIVITIRSNKVSFEKVQPDGRTETMRFAKISKPSDLNTENMIDLIYKVLSEE